jgi:putative transcriptional regulator
LNNSNKKLIAEKLKNLRANKSREEVAVSNGISISALQMYENAQRVPKDDIKVKLANYYGVSVQEIFFDIKLHKSCSKSENQQPA